ncbi:MAG TPA: 2-dehydropantoate 2-reductase [Candidatus Binatia bacterium]|nr:2-dehydropantoate 2-reductase [Candidatus Binatia bacterium]
MGDRILVAGCGAVGSVFAGLLAGFGCDVHVLGRGAHLDAIADAGVRIDGIWGDHFGRPAAAVTDAERLDGGFDAILIACKSFHTGPLARQVGAQRLADGGAVISLQNGLGNWERLTEIFGAEAVLAARVIFGAEVVAPGTVRVTVEAEPVLVGHPCGETASALRWAEVFRLAGIRALATDSILAALWGKVFYNAALNPMGALLGLRYGELAADPLRRSVMDRVISEAFAVATAEGVSMPWSEAAQYLSHFYGKLVPATAGHRSSMLQDLERGRPTEIDAICGEICRRADIAGIDAAANRVLFALLRGGGAP